MHKERYIVHVDMDAFFASIEQRDTPEYRFRPLVVGSDPKGGKGRGVVSTCSYEARKFGIRSAMPISIAYRMCPDAIFLPVDMEKYADVSQQIYAILREFTPDIEPVSIDEAFLDISGSYHLFGTPKETCLKIKARISRETGLTASVGLAPTMMAAKIASDLEKPDGMVVVTKNSLLDFLWPLGIRRLWGLGEKAEKNLSQVGIKTIGDLAHADPDNLAHMFGKSGVRYWELANGIDTRKIETSLEAKSIGSETTFDEDTSDKKIIESTLMLLCEKVSDRLRKEDVRARTITLKIRFEDFSTYTRSVTLNESTNFVDVLYKEAKALYNNFDPGNGNRRPKNKKRVRLLGLKASRILHGNEKTLFDEQINAKSENIHKAVDTIKRRFGSAAIRRASGIEAQTI